MCYRVPGQTWPSELCWLYDQFAKSRSHAEVGTYCGRSLLASCGGMAPGAVVVAIDNDSEAPNAAWVQAVRAATIRVIPQSVKLIESGSMEAARLCFAQGLRFDSVFIDACHEYAECCADIQAWRSVLKPGGIISGHDYWPVHIGVMDAVNELLPGFSIVPNTRIWFAINS